MELAPQRRSQTDGEGGPPAHSEAVTPTTKQTCQKRELQTHTAREQRCGTLDQVHAKPAQRHTKGDPPVTKPGCGSRDARPPSCPGSVRVTHRSNSTNRRAKPSSQGHTSQHVQAPRLLSTDALTRQGGEGSLLS